MPVDCRAYKATIACRRRHAVRLGQPPDSSGAGPPEHKIGPVLERRCKAAECGIEHRAHEETERATPEFISNEEFDVARRLRDCMEMPLVLHPAERTVEIFDEN